MGEHEPLVSIVVPVYNVEEYLERCVRSITSQTYQKLEIILVDDGSPDRCGEICETFAQNDSRIKVYHKQNGGPSEARNFGVSYANGEYISFIDSDDYIAPDYIEYLLKLLNKYNADIACCDMAETDEDTADCYTDNESPKEEIFTGKEACQMLFTSMHIAFVTVWGKLYRSDIVKKYAFPVGRIHEDEAMTCKYYYEAERVVLGNKCLYVYFQNEKSIMHTRGNNLNPDLIWTFEHRARFFEEHDESKLAKIAWNYLYNCYVHDSIQNQGRADHLIKTFDRGQTLDLKTRLEVKLYNISPYIYRKCLDIKNALEKVIRKTICK